LDSDEKLYAQQLAIWEQIKNSRDPKSFASFLDKYPSGYFSELAEERLDILLSKSGEKKVQIVNAKGNPFSKGTVSGIGNYSIGDTYSYADMDLISNAVITEYAETVTGVSDTEVIFNDGERVLDRLGNEIKTKHHRFLSPVQFFPVQYSVGHKWSTYYNWLDGRGRNATVDADFKVVNRDATTMPYGNFNAYYVESYGSVIGSGIIHIKYWIDPEQCHRPLVYELRTETRNGRLGEAKKTILTSYKQRNKA